MFETEIEALQKNIEEGKKQIEKLENIKNQIELLAEMGPAKLIKKWKN